MGGTAVSGTGDQRIVAHDPAWAGRYRELAAALEEALPPDVTVEHYGSTSVPGLGGRPILDIQLAVPSVRDRTHYESALTRLGYKPFVPPDMAALAEDGMLIYVPADDSNTVHVAVCQAGGFHNRRQLAVRDYLRARPDEAAAYEAVKRQAAEAAHGVREAYAAAKADYVVGLQERALRWRGGG